MAATAWSASSPAATCWRRMHGACAKPTSPARRWAAAPLRPEAYFRRAAPEVFAWPHIGGQASAPCGCHTKNSPDSGSPVSRANSSDLPLGEDAAALSLPVEVHL